MKLSEDYDEIIKEIPSGEASLLAIRMRGYGVDGKWAPPGGRFDFETLVEPGLFSNVVNGFGFVGASVEARVSWILSDQVAWLVGYQAYIPDTTGDGTCNPEDFRCTGGQPP